MTVPFQPLDRLYREQQVELDEIVNRVANSGWYILGPELESFERDFADSVGCKHCIGVGNGFDALHLSLRALDIGTGDEVVVPANTYVATWLAVMATGATPVPVEPETDGFNIDPARISDAISLRTRALLPVHLYGHPARMPAIAALADRHGLALLEDCAQAHGATIAGRAVGSFSDAGCWSFYPTKNLGALGDGGAITTNDAALARRLRAHRNYGSIEKYRNEFAGHNSRLDELQAAVLRARLRRLDAWNSRRGELAAVYRAKLDGVGPMMPRVGGDCEPVWHQFVIRDVRRDALRKLLADRGVQTMIHYPVPPHRQAACRGLNIEDTALRETVSIHDQVLSLPVHPHLTDEEQDEVIAAVRHACASMDTDPTEIGR